jgi:NAD(P)-dependent dehydrogenase (short-subunit alcohol dehydrogenase family)
VLNRSDVIKVLLVGASGTIGQAIVNEIESDTEIVTASLNQGDYKLDLSDPASIAALFDAIGSVDAVVCAAARGVVFKSLADMGISDYVDSMQQKCLGQINIALHAIKVLNDGGSITLTTGIMNHEFVAGGSAAAMANSAVEGFVQAAALDLPRGIRINVVSPALLEASAERYARLCPGFEPVSGAKVARAYRKSIYGIHTGRIYHVG